MQVDTIVIAIAISEWNVLFFECVENLFLLWFWNQLVERPHEFDGDGHALENQ
jgi:hypothetical protein